MEEKRGVENGTVELSDLAVFVFGNNASGQLGLGTSEEQVAEPTLLRSRAVQPGARTSVKFAASARHTAAVVDGLLQRCGEGDHRSFQAVGATESFSIEDVCAGEDFACAATSDGRLLSWGQNDMGQLASGDREARGRPKFSDTFGGDAIIQLCAGRQHGMALSRSGAVYTWGANRTGQLGNGTLVSSITPALVAELRHRPVVQIACGDSHAIVRTVTGITYAWGENNRGQLGLGDTKNRFRPECIRVLRAARPKDIGAGGGFSVVIGEAGVAFAFGANNHGQLGLGPDIKSVASPTVIESLREQPLIQVACGMAHTLLVHQNGKRMYVCGLNSSGQLGLGHTQTVYHPVSVPAPGEHRIKCVFSGPLAYHSISLTARPEVQLLFKAPLPSIDLDALKSSIVKLQQSMSLGHNYASALKQLRSLLAAAFSSISVMNASFRKFHHGYTVRVNERESGIDLVAVRTAYNAILSLENEQVLATLGRATLHLAAQLAECPIDEPENLGVFLVLLENPLLLQPASFFTALEKVVSVLLGLPKLQRNLVYGWLRAMPSEFFARVIYLLQCYLSFALSNSHKVVDPAPAVLLLKTLCEANRERHVVPDWLFYNHDIPRTRNVAEDFLQFLRSGDNVFTFARYPFLLSAEVKSKLIRMTARQQMHASMVQHIAHHGNTPSQPLPQDAPPGTRVMLTFAGDRDEDAMIYGEPELDVRLVFRVRRDKLLSDTIMILLKVLTEDPKQLRLPIHIEFVNETAIDYGGVAKEFFMLVIREFIQQLDILKETSSGRYLWFTSRWKADVAQFISEDVPVDNSGRDYSESFELHLLLGILVGLAAFNGCFVDFPVPPALYKRISGEPLSIEDLQAVDEELANGLQQLLDFDGDVEHAFGINFVVPANPLMGFVELSQQQDEQSDDRKFVMLVKNGDEKIVTRTNRREYVEEYVQYAFHKAVKEQVDRFVRGFTMVLGGPALGLCTNTEIDLLIGGLPDFGNFAAIRETARYSGEFHDQHPVIQWFWSVLKELPDTLKRKFLVFVTGSSRMPLGGPQKLMLMIQSIGENDQLLPTAHTCFNILDLPVYTNEEILKERLLLALKHEHGFGLA